MAFIVNSKLSSTVNVVKPTVKKTTCIKLPYEIPERYRNSFYLANAAFFDSTNWFLHKAYEVIFPTLKHKLKEITNDDLNNDEIAERVENVVQVLDQCNSVIDIRFPLKRDNGKYELIRGFRSQYGSALGYSANLGGFRTDENLTRDHIKALSVLSTYRNACLGIGLAGAFGGIKIHPKNYSRSELQQIVQSYVSELIQKGYCNDRDVFQPDINSDQQDMNWICDSHAKMTGRKLNIAAVGKKSELGGIPNYSQTSSQGTYLALNVFINNEEMMKKLGLPTGLKDKTFIIQGLGKLGKPLAELLISSGAVCVGVKDHDAYLYDSKGIKFKELCQFKEKHGSIKDYENANQDLKDKIFTEQCDILILAAYQKSLVCYTADKVKAKVVVEAADGPVTPTAHKILTSRSKLVLPDIFACSGATIASFFEYLKNFHQIHGVCDNMLAVSNPIYESAINSVVRSEEKLSSGGSVTLRSTSLDVMSERNIVMETLECILSDVGKEMIGITELHNLGIDIRTAAYMVAINNIFGTIYSRKRFL